VVMVFWAEDVSEPFDEQCSTPVWLKERAVLFVADLDRGRSCRRVLGPASDVNVGLWADEGGFLAAFALEGQLRVARGPAPAQWLASDCALSELSFGTAPHPWPTNDPAEAR